MIQQKNYIVKRTIFIVIIILIQRQNDHTLRKIYLKLMKCKVYFAEINLFLEILNLFL